MDASAIGGIPLVTRSTILEASSDNATHRLADHHVVTRVAQEIIEDLSHLVGIELSLENGRDVLHNLRLRMCQAGVLHQSAQEAGDVAWNVRNANSESGPLLPHPEDLANQALHPADRTDNALAVASVTALAAPAWPSVSIRSRAIA
jgi:hypothetical protein